MKARSKFVYTDRPPTRCVWCLKPAWSESDTCRNCRGIESYSTAVPSQAHALTGGRWVSRGGIKVWTGPRPADDEQVVRRDAARCGTDSGYRKHYRAGEEACGPCKAAHSEANKRSAA